MQEIFDQQDMTGLAASIDRGDVSPREVLAFSLDRLAERNPAVNAVVADRVEQAMAEVDAGLPRGPLHGVPFAIKDLHSDVAGLPSTSGSRLFADVVPSKDSELVRRYRAAGMVIIGKTNTPEFGQNASTEPLLFGPTRNPHRLSHSSGGSSGGSSAAVAAGIVPAAHASDGGGSIRLPAAMTGLVGLKPSRGRVPAGNPMSAPVTVQHALTRSVRDSALLLDLTCAPRPGAPFTIAPPARPYVREVGADPGRLRIAVSTRTPEGVESHPDCVASVLKTAELLSALGHEVAEASPRYPLDDLQKVRATGVAAPMAAAIDVRLAQLGRELRDDDLEPLVRMIYDRVKSLDAADMVLALEALGRAAETIGGFFVDHDLLLTPTVPTLTPELGLMDTSDPAAVSRHDALFYASFTRPFNATGQPAISLPLGADGTGMPIGVQLVAGFGREDILFRVSGQLEAAQPWSIAPVWPAR